jgi:adenosine kinase
MRIAVTGSIATDHLMKFPGKFHDQLIADKLDKVALSFLVDELQIRRGGVAANIAFGLGCLGLRPLLVGTAGADFAEYRQWLEHHGVDTSGVRESQLRHTARFVATTDEVGNQIASFYAGAMSEDRDLRLDFLGGNADLLLVGASDPDAMMSFTTQSRELGIPFAADSSWQLARLDGEQVHHLVDGAAYLFSNEYEAALIENKTGWSPQEVLSHVGTRVTTLGAQGVRVERAGADTVEVGGIPDAQMAEPTGAGDAFRSGFLAAISWGLSHERAAQLGNLLAVHVLETIGTQEYELKAAPALDRLATAYGQQAADDIAEYLTT